jgi:hypothetical protein
MQGTHVHHTKEALEPGDLFTVWDRQARESAVVGTEPRF